MQVRTTVAYVLSVVFLLSLAVLGALNYRVHSLVQDPKYLCVNPPNYPAVTKTPNSSGGFDHCDVTFHVDDKGLEATGHVEVGLLAGDTLSFEDRRSRQFQYRISSDNSCFPPVTDVTANHDMPKHPATTVVFYGTPLLKPECKYHVTFAWSNDQQADPHISVGGRSGKSTK